MPRLLSRKRPSVQSPLDTYFNEIKQTPLLSAEEERKLAYRIEAGDSAARDHMIRANLRLVVTIARRYAGSGVELQDLIEEGNLGLLRAVEGFDPSMNTRFSTYASFWIKQSIRIAQINTCKTIRVPAHMVNLLSKWRQASIMLQDAMGRTPTQEEVADNLRLSTKQQSIITNALRIDHLIPQTDQVAGLSLEEMLVDGRTKTSDTDMSTAEDQHQVLDLLSKMDKREAAVLRLRFGLAVDAPKTFQEIGERLGLTRERIRQIAMKALSKLHESLGGA
jgi:RNA polymerase primary sigma factor